MCKYVLIIKYIILDLIKSFVKSLFELFPARKYNLIYYFNEFILLFFIIISLSCIYFLSFVLNIKTFLIFSCQVLLKFKIFSPYFDKKKYRCLFSGSAVPGSTRT